MLLYIVYPDPGTIFGHSYSTIISKLNLYIYIPMMTRWKTNYEWKILILFQLLNLHILLCFTWKLPMYEEETLPWRSFYSLVILFKSSTRMPVVVTFKRDLIWSGKLRWVTYYCHLLSQLFAASVLAIVHIVALISGNFAVFVDCNVTCCSCCSRWYLFYCCLVLVLISYQTSHFIYNACL